MPMITRQPHTIYRTAAAAAAVVAKMGDDLDGWEYRVVPDPNGGPRAIIAVYDEAGEFVDNL